MRTPVCISSEVIKQIRHRGVLAADLMMSCWAFIVKEEQEVLSCRDDSWFEPRRSPAAAEE